MSSIKFLFCLLVIVAISGASGETLLSPFASNQVCTMQKCDAVDKDSNMTIYSTSMIPTKKDCDKGGKCEYTNLEFTIKFKPVKATINKLVVTFEFCADKDYENVHSQTQIIEGQFAKDVNSTITFSFKIYPSNVVSTSNTYTVAFKLTFENNAGKLKKCIIGAAGSNQNDPKNNFDKFPFLSFDI